MVTKQQVEQFFFKKVELLDCAEDVYFGWNNMKKVAGIAAKRYFNGQHIYTVEISEFYLTAFKDPEDVFDTVLHELAHVAANYYAEEPMSSHGPVWKFHAVSLGAKPERCFTGDCATLKLNKFKYTAYCPEPGCDVGCGVARLGKVWQYNWNSVPNRGYQCTRHNRILKIKQNY